MILLLKRSFIFFLAAVLLFGTGLGLYAANTDIFFSLGWFFIFASLVSTIRERLSTKKGRLIFYCAISVTVVVWFILNDRFFYLITTSVNSNPYGEYFIDQFEFRLTLSIFVLKIILTTWLTETRLVLAGILFLAYLIILPRFFKSAFMSLPARYFEFIVSSSLHLAIESRRYLATSFSLALINGLLWGLAAFFLQFDNFILMTFIMLLCAFVPHIGLFVAAALSLLFVESGLFLIQLGGLMIALASIWFVDHTLLKNQFHLHRYVPPGLLIFPPIFGYLIFSFLGFFLSSPLLYMSAVSSKIIFKNLPLVHKTIHPVPRNA